MKTGGEMSNKTQAINELNIAYKTEVAGYHFYTTAAAYASDAKGRAVFTNLAKDELTHIMVISNISDSLKKGAGWVGFDEALKTGASLAQKGLPIFPEENEFVKRLGADRTDLNAVSIGIEIEEAAVEFYSRLLKEAAGADEKVVLTKLLEMEKGHLKILRWESESLRKTGFWGETMEYSVEKERE
ncbi:MAG: ferritin family protein [Deltaproteobacteria bacterium]|nr:ferritin family protein [Deltaproteobacteria bacterium]